MIIAMTLASPGNWLTTLLALSERRDLFVNMLSTTSREWVTNKLPEDIRRMRSIPCFLSFRKSHLLSESFPPISHFFSKFNSYCICRYNFVNSLFTSGNFLLFLCLGRIQWWWWWHVLYVYVYICLYMCMTDMTRPSGRSDVQRDGATGLWENVLTGVELTGCPCCAFLFSLPSMINTIMPPCFQFKYQTVRRYHITSTCLYLSLPVARGVCGQSDEDDDDECRKTGNKQTYPIHQWFNSFVTSCVRSMHWLLMNHRAPLSSDELSGSLFCWP